MNPMKIHRRSRIIEATRQPPRILELLRRLRPKTPPDDPAAIWLLLIRPASRRSPHGGPHFTVEPLWLGPREAEPGRFGDPDSRTSIGVLSMPTFPEIIYQTLHVKLSWQRRGIITATLLRLQDHLRDEGAPFIEGSFTHAGWGIATHMRDRHGWGILGSPPATPSPLP